MNLENKQIKKHSLRYLVTKIILKRDENFLIKQGLRKAKEQKLEIDLGDEILTLNGKRGRISLSKYNGKVDARKLVALVADDYPEETKRYLVNRERLSI